MTTPDLLFVVYAVLVTTASFIHLIRLDYWWIRIWDFPHLQLTALTLLGLLAWLGFSRNGEWPLAGAVAGLSAAALYQGWLIYPYTRLHKRQVQTQTRRTPKEPKALNTIRLLSANVYMENTRTPDVQRLIDKYKPDVVLLLETNEAWRTAMRSIENTYAYRVLCPLENTYGMLLYSRLPIRRHELRFLIQQDIPSVYAEIELPSGQVVHFYGVHPMPPSPTEHYRSTERDAELLVVGRECRRHTEPVIVAGDLNDVAWSHTTRLFQRVSGLLDPRVGRGLFSTFHARYFFLRWPLDHVFVSHHFRLQILRRLPNCGSDHFPILVGLALQPDDASAGIDLPEPEGDDLAETQAIIDKAS